MFDFQWREQEGGQRMQFRVDNAYGVQRIPDREFYKASVVDDIPKPLTFRGIPILSSDMAVQSVTHVKKWKRLNRPAKRRTRRYDVPVWYVMNENGQKTIVAHPQIIAKLENRYEQ